MYLFKIHLLSNYYILDTKIQIVTSSLLLNSSQYDAINMDYKCEISKERKAQDGKKFNVKGSIAFSRS